MFVSIHIPKTAGTLLAYIFDYGSDRKIWYDYDPSYATAKYADAEYIRRHKEFILKEFRFIHGHFFYQKYADLFPEAKFVTCVRHPVDRVISHYLHARDDANAHLHKAIHEGLDVVEFAEQPNVGNAQARHLEGRPIKEYDFVFVNEELAWSLHYFQALTGFRRGDPYCGLSGEESIPKMNTAQDRRHKKSKPTFTEQQRAAIYNRTQEDNEVYRLALEKFHEIGRKVSGMTHAA